MNRKSSINGDAAVGRVLPFKDLLASLTVFLIAIPLCMGIAIASGAPPATGLITGIIGGIIAGSLSGCPLQVSGPAAGLVVVVAEIIQDYGFGALGLIITVAGLLQLIAGFTRIGRWFRAVSPAVISGMLSGIGALIVLSQLHVSFDQKPHTHGIANAQALPELFQLCMNRGEGEAARTAGMVALITIACLLVWPRLRLRVCKAIPGPLVAVLVACLVTWSFDLPIKKVTLPSNLADAFRLPTTEWYQHFNGVILGEAFVLALIASAETLLSATAVDRMKPGQKTNYDRELLSQGVGNTLCGLIGGLPMTGVIVRSGTNVQAGATSRLSTILHGIWILMAVVLVPWLLELVPTSCLGAVLVFTGFKLLDFKAFKALRRYGRLEVAVFLSTFLGIVFGDLLTGVLLGVALAAGRLLVELSELEVDVQHCDGVCTVRLKGAASFVTLPRLSEALELISAPVIHIDLSDLRFIDHGCIELLQQQEKQAAARGTSFHLDWGTIHALKGPCTKPM